MSHKQSWHNSLHHSSFLALTTAILCLLAFLHLLRLLCNMAAWLSDLCLILIGGSMWLQHYSKCLAPTSCLSAVYLLLPSQDVHVYDLPTIGCCTFRGHRLSLLGHGHFHRPGCHPGILFLLCCEIQTSHCCTSDSCWRLICLTLISMYLVIATARACGTLCVVSIKMVV